MKKIYIINGPNLNMLGKREKEVYGTKSLENINKECVSFIKEEKINFKLFFFQSNSEQEIIEKIQKADQFDAIIINAAAFTHTSIAIHDSLKILKIPIIEVHISNLSQREEFRKKSYISIVSSGIITGFGSDVYLLALKALNLKFNKDYE